jgi:hypothetical protein
VKGTSIFAKCVDSISFPQNNVQIVWWKETENRENERDKNE